LFFLVYDFKQYIFFLGNYLFIGTPLTAITFHDPLNNFHTTLAFCPRCHQWNSFLPWHIPTALADKGAGFPEFYFCLVLL